jgi:nucleoside-triphosphatase
MGDVLLLTGRPGSGKTTVVRRLAEAFPGRVGGFYTEELREGGQRVGFVLVTLAGQRAVFAHVAWKQHPHRVGRYGVDLQVLEATGVPAVRQAVQARQAVLVDELGKMELLSPTFRQVVEEAADSPAPLVATVLLGSHPWADGFRRRPRVTQVVVSPANREEVFRFSESWLRGRL